MKLLDCCRSFINTMKSFAVSFWIEFDAQKINFASSSSCRFCSFSWRWFSSTIRRIGFCYSDGGTSNLKKCKEVMIDMIINLLWPFYTKDIHTSIDDDELSCFIKFRMLLSAEYSNHCLSITKEAEMGHDVNLKRH
jgi:hypothetical protein